MIVTGRISDNYAAMPPKFDPSQVVDVYVYITGGEAKCNSRCCCCCCPYRSSTSCSSGGDGSAAVEAGPVQNHVLTGSMVGVATVPSHGLYLQYSSLTQRGYYPDTLVCENQDAICIRTNLQGNPNHHFFGVFDGHAFLAVNSLLHKSEIDDSMSGTTGITVPVSGDTLFVANVGDSRAVMGVLEDDRLVAKDLSHDLTGKYYVRSPHVALRADSNRMTTCDTDILNKRRQNMTS